ncbi:hypothetical protein MP228_000228 [Amoeboaphelidium protococcarum]|nr:hypothetical protein MP228_000228 [Amoeboaphelidium protococcarum]
MMNPVLQLMVIGVVFHFIYLWSIFDIYFKSPIVHGMQQYSIGSLSEHSEAFKQHGPIEPPAKRLVLVVADGLRADKLYDYDYAPFLKSIYSTCGTHGVSHTRVPTESRPGHVAIIGGLYEDVSAVMKGWKENPVEFDSVFNQSRAVFSFGSPDILLIFKSGEMYMYDAHDEDFGMQDARQLDQFSFDKVAQLYKDSSTNGTLRQLLNQDGLVIFLHLLGIDTNGHAHRPSSHEYMDNIAFVDKQLRNFSSWFDQYYNHDKKTAYVFTADHGMGELGSHGDGHPDNTQTPLLAWGAGIRDQPDLQIDVNQADIAPLMASLLGINYPVNSVGQLPIKYLQADSQVQAAHLLVNARQIYAMYRLKEDQRRSREPFFIAFSELSDEYAQQLFEQIDQLILSKEFDESIQLCEQIMTKSLEGLRYLQTYDWFFLRSIISAGYLGWIIFSAVFILQKYVYQRKVYELITRFDNWSLASLVMFPFSVVFYMKQSPPMYYAYALFPVIFWTQIFRNQSVIQWSVQDLSQRVSRGQLIAYGAGYLIILEFLVMSYHYRQVLSVLFIGFGGYYLYSSSSRLKSSYLLYTWPILCVVSSSFTLLSPQLVENAFLFTIGGVMHISIGVLQLVFGTRDNLIAFQILLSSLALVFTNWSVYRLQSKMGLSYFNQICSWLILVVSILLPLYKSYGQSVNNYRLQLVRVFLTFSPLMITFSISYESIFYAVYFMTLICWLEIEKLLHGDKFELKADASEQDDSKSSLQVHRNLNLHDMVLALQFLFFINVAFFGTGNIASVSSFTLQSVYRLTTTFNPFLMGGLLVLKILTPFALLSAVFGVLSAALDLPPFALFLLSLSVTDVVTLNFFFLVRDDGSWLEIGTSISHFVIACLFEVFSIILFLLSRLLVGQICTKTFRIQSQKAK